MKGLAGVFAAILLGLTRLPTGAAPVPLTCAHAHNDYEHARPLLDALDHGFCSVEADIFLVDGKLLVAHDADKVSPQRTLRAIYLEALRARVRSNGGRVYPHGPEVTLLVDLKSDWQRIYPVLRQELQRYSDILSAFRGDKKIPGAVTVIITGNRSRDMFAGETLRYACLDGDLPDLQRNDSPNLVPWISTNWQKVFQWRGRGPVPESDLFKLKQIVSQAHQQGRRVRFWGAPDTAGFWKFLRQNGVDLINTDDLAGAQEFLLSQ